MRTQESIEKKIVSLIKKGNQIYEIFFKKEYNENYGEIMGYHEVYDPDVKEMATPAHYSDALYELKKWQKQCQNLTSKLPLENTVYTEILDLLADKKDKKDREIYLTAIDIQEIVLNLEAILEDLKDGMFENIFLAIEVQSVLNHIEQAEELFDEDNHILAGLVTLFSLESLLTELCKDNLGNDQLPQGLERKSNWLKNKGIITKQTNKIIKNLVETRNDITHGDFQLVHKERVKEVIIEVKSIVRTQITD